MFILAKTKVKKYLCTKINSITYNSKKWKQPKCLLLDEWINKIWYIHTIEYYLILTRKQISETHYNMDVSVAQMYILDAIELIKMIKMVNFVLCILPQLNFLI